MAVSPTSATVNQTSNWYSQNNWHSEDQWNNLLHPKISDEDISGTHDHHVDGLKKILANIEKELNEALDKSEMPELIKGPLAYLIGSIKKFKEYLNWKNQEYIQNFDQEVTTLKRDLEVKEKENAELQKLLESKISKSTQSKTKNIKEIKTETQKIIGPISTQSNLEIKTRSSWDIRKKAAASLGQFPLESIKDQITQLLNDDAWQVQQTTLQSLSKHSELEAIKSWKMQQSKDAPCEVQKTISTLEAIKSKVMPLLQSAAWEIRKEAFSFLIQHSELDEINSEILPLWDDSDTWQVHQTILQSFIKHPVLKEEKDAIGFKLLHGVSATREYILNLLECEPELERVINKVVPFLQSKEWSVQKEAVELLSPYLSLEKVKSEVMPLLKDSAWETIKVIAPALAVYLLPEGAKTEVASEDAKANVVPLLTRNIWQLRQAALQALVPSSRSEEIKSAMMPSLNDKIFEVRKEAVQALTRRLKTLEEVTTYLIPLLEDREWEVRQAVVKSLCNHPLLVEASSLRKYILQRLEDEKWEIRQTTILLLKENLFFSQLEAIKSKIVPLLQDKQGEVRYAAAQLLIPHLSSIEILDHIFPIIDKLLPNWQQIIFRSFEKRLALATLERKIILQLKEWTSQVKPEELCYLSKPNLQESSFWPTKVA